MSMTLWRSLRILVRGARGVTLIELLTALSIGILVVGMIFLLVHGVTRTGQMVHARVSDQDQGRQALAWVADRLRQVRYDPQATCPDGFIRIGSGDGFANRLAFRAIIDEQALAGRRIFVFYLEGRTLWYESRAEGPRESCSAEAERTRPALGRAALTPAIVQAFELRYFGKDGQQATVVSAVRSIGMTLRLGAGSTPGPEPQTFQTVVTIRGP